MLIEVKNDNDIYLVDDDEDFHYLMQRNYKKNQTISNKIISFIDGDSCINKLKKI